MGDAAQASSPHHGTGASFGVDDALCLFVTMPELTMELRQYSLHKAKALRAAFGTYDKVRGRSHSG